MAGKDDMRAAAVEIAKGLSNVARHYDLTDMEVAQLLADHLHSTLVLVVDLKGAP